MAIHIRLLGGFCVVAGAEQRHLFIPPRAAKLFTYCLFHRECWHSREHLIDLFWPDVPLEQARSCLNSTLSRLRQAFPPDVGSVLVAEGREAFSLAEGLKLSVDVDLFIHVVRIDRLSSSEPTLTENEATQLKEALDLYRGDLLPGWYDDWVLIERERLRHIYIVGLSQLMGHFSHTGALELAIAYGRRLLVLEPLQESVHRSMMQLFMRTGHRAAAFKQYAQCCNLLKEELGVKPMDETQVLYARIAASDESSRQPLPATGQREKPRTPYTQTSQIS